MKSQKLTKAESLYPKLFHRFGLEGEPLQSGALRLSQVHSDRVVNLESIPNSERSFEAIAKIEADALVARSGLVAVQTGDCLPVLFFGQTTVGQDPLFSAAHAGWRGLKSGVLENTVDALFRIGVKSNTLIAAIGPAIGPCCFEVDQNTFATFEKDPKNSPYLFRTQPAPSNQVCEREQAGSQGNNLWIDLAGIAICKLKQAGLSPENIDHLAICTYCGNHRLASYRRATHKGIKAGRQWSVVGVL